MMPPEIESALSKQARAEPQASYANYGNPYEQRQRPPQWASPQPLGNPFAGQVFSGSGMNAYMRHSPKATQMLRCHSPGVTQMLQMSPQLGMQQQHVMQSVPHG